MRKAVSTLTHAVQLFAPKGLAIVLMLFFLLVQLLYWPAAKAGFVTDYTGLLARLDGAQFKDFLHSFGFPALHPVTNFFLYCFHQLFGTTGLGWHLAHTLLHAFNAWLVFRLSAKIITMLGLQRPLLVACATALLFLAHPYNVEPVVWRVCFNHLFTASLILSGLWYALRYFEEKRTTFLWGAHGLFGVALFAFETAVVFPMLLVVFALITTDQLRLRQWLLLLVPPFSMLSAWASLNNYLFGSVVGHYGADVHLRFYPPEIAANLTKYLLKYLLYWRHWPHGRKEALMQFLDKPLTGWILFAAMVVFVWCFLFFLRKTTTRLRLLMGSLVAFFAALVPVSNLYVYWLLYGENDRYGYLASFFFSLALVVGLTQWRWRLGQTLLTLLGLFNLFATWQQVQLWKCNSQVVEKALATWQWTKEPEIYVLAYPENYRGTYMFRDHSGRDEGLLTALHYIAGIRPQGKVIEVAQFNLANRYDGVSVSPAGPGVFNCRFNQWGNWWWYRGMGASNHETPYYRFSVDGNGSIVELKKPAAGVVAVWWDGHQWQAMPADVKQQK